MKIKLLLYLLFFFLLIGCKNKSKLPKDVIPRQKMEAVLWDMLRAGEFLDSYVFNKDTAVNKVTESEKWYDKIYQVHGITKEQFKKSFAYYKDNLAAFKPILDSLSKKEMDDNQASQSTPDSNASQTPVDPELLKRKDSLLKQRREAISKSKVIPAAN